MKMSEELSIEELEKILEQKKAEYQAELKRKAKEELLTQQEAEEKTILHAEPTPEGTVISLSKSKHCEHLRVNDRTNIAICFLHRAHINKALEYDVRSAPDRCTSIDYGCKDYE
jgi:hypothetical protein